MALHAWILAGGQSTRFGSDKAEHVVDGERLLDRTARVCAEAGLPAHVVARHLRAGALPTEVEPATAPRHPLTGVAVALAAAAALGHPAAVVLPVDLVDLPPDTLRALAAAPPPAYARGQPLLATLPVALADAATAAAARGHAVRQFLAEAGAIEVSVPAPTNLNRPPPPPRSATAR